MTYDISTQWTIVISLAVIWEAVWKGIALWRAAQNSQMGWYVVLFLVNSLGILPIIYLLTHPRRSEANKDTKPVI